GASGAEQQRRRRTSSRPMTFSNRHKQRNPLRSQSAVPPARHDFLPSGTTFRFCHNQQITNYQPLPINASRKLQQPPGIAPLSSPPKILPCIFGASSASKPQTAVPRRFP